MIVWLQGIFIFTRELGTLHFKVFNVVVMKFFNVGFFLRFLMLLFSHAFGIIKLVGFVLVRQSTG